jgi:hypothetical protein
MQMKAPKAVSPRSVDEAFENRSVSSETASLEEQGPLSENTSPLEVEPVEADGRSNGSTNESRRTLGVWQLVVIIFYSVSGE